MRITETRVVVYPEIKDVAGFMAPWYVRGERRLKSDGRMSVTVSQGCGPKLFVDEDTWERLKVAVEKVFAALAD